MCKIWLQLLEHTVCLLLYENMLACRAAAGLFGSAVPERIDTELLLFPLSWFGPEVFLLVPAGLVGDLSSVNT